MKMKTIDQEWSIVDSGEAELNDSWAAFVEQKEVQLVEGFATVFDGDQLHGNTKQADLASLEEQKEMLLLEAQTKQDALAALVEQKEMQLTEAYAKQAVLMEQKEKQADMFAFVKQQEKQLTEALKQKEMQLTKASAKRAALVEQNKQLKAAFDKQAAEIMCQWASIGTDVFSNTWAKEKKDYVVGRLMKSGVYKWSFRVEKGAENLTFGIMPMPLRYGSMPYLGSRSGEWGIQYGTDGTWSRRHDKKRVQVKGLSPLSTGSIITLTLSLAETNGNRLEASVDGGDFVSVFEGDKLYGHESGFAPAASLKDVSSIRFLGFE